LQDFTPTGVSLYEERNHSQFMKKIIFVLTIVALGSSLLNAQQPPPGLHPYQSPPAPQLTHFDLDFPGGTPSHLVKEIETASGKPLNAIIPPEDENLLIPPLKMRSVTVPDLFTALTFATHKTANVVTGTYIGGDGKASSQYQQVQIAYGFKTEGTPRDESIWYFYNYTPPPPPGQEPKPDRICRFFQLEHILETYKIEDITTAIETGWKMLGAGHDFTPPEISFHKDTKLLIAVGEPEKLHLIDTVLEQLTMGQTLAAKAPAPAKSGEPAKP